MSELTPWNESSDSRIAYFSGTAAYRSSFYWDKVATGPVWLDLGNVANLGEVFVNDVACGIAWTSPYRVRIDSGLRQGENELRIEVTNTWANRLIGELAKPEGERTAWTLAPLNILEDEPLLTAGLLGPVRIFEEAN